jgi:hypothetical protein
MLTAEFGTGQVFWSMLWFFLFVIWIWLLFAVFSDIFRSDDLSGWGKGLWSIFVILVPYLGVFVYIIARGHKMQEHSMRAAAAQEAALRDHIRDVSGSDSSPADQIAKLAELRDKGAIDEAEFQRLKAQAMG